MQRGVFGYGLHLSLLLLTFNEIGNNKFVFPGVMVQIAMLHSHFTLKSFQQKNFMGRGRRFGTPSQFLNHTDISDFRALGVGFYCLFFFCFPHNSSREERL